MNKHIVLLLVVLSMEATSFSQPVNAVVKKNFSVIAYVRCRSAEDIQKIDYSMITHIHFAFLNPDSTGNYTYNECLDSLVKRAHANGVKILASIGGGSAPEYYTQLLAAPQRDQLIARTAGLAAVYDLDGIDVDLEGSRIDSNYEAFVTGLATALKLQGKLITAAMATPYGPTVTDNALKQFDYITVMSYDKTGPWRPEKPGPHAPYSAAVDDLHYWGKERKVSKSKMHLGVPFYGYSFGPSGASYMRYADIVAGFPGSEEKDELTLKDGGILYYNGIPTIRKKVKLAKKKASGIMFWELSQDTTGDKSLLKTINEIARP